LKVETKQLKTGSQFSNSSIGINMFMGKESEYFFQLYNILTFKPSTYLIIDTQNHDNSNVSNKALSEVFL